MKSARHYQARHYQVEDAPVIVAALATVKEVGVLSGTGSGKSLLALLVAAVLQHSRTFTHVIVAAPTNVIRRGFVVDAETYVDCGDFGRWRLPMHVRRVNDNKSEGLIAYLNTRTSEHELLATTQQTLCGSITAFVSANLHHGGQIARGVLLVFDESHHLNTEKEKAQLQKFRKEFLAAGGAIMYMSATPDRGDGCQSVPDHVEWVVQRPLAWLMANGYAPSKIIDFAINVPGDGKDSEDSLGIPKNYLDAMHRVHRDILEHHGNGELKATVRIQSQDFEKNHRIIGSMAKKLIDTGVRTYVASDRHNVDSNMVILLDVQRRSGKPIPTKLEDRFGYLMDYEKSIQHFSESCVDVIIGIQKVVEGFDWFVCNHVYMLGIPRRIPTAVQLIGRATRSRQQLIGYPEAWRDCSRVVMITAGFSGKSYRHVHYKQFNAVVACIAGLRYWTMFDIVAGIHRNPTAGKPVLDEAAIMEVVEACLPSVSLQDYIRSLSVEAIQQLRGRENCTLYFNPQDKKSVLIRFTTLYWKHLKVNAADHHKLLPQVDERMIKIVLAGSDQGVQEKTQKIVQDGIDTDATTEKIRQQLDEMIDEQVRSSDDKTFISGDGLLEQISSLVITPETIAKVSEELRVATADSPIWRGR